MQDKQVDGAQDRLDSLATLTAVTLDKCVSLRFDSLAIHKTISDSAAKLVTRDWSNISTFLACSKLIKAYVLHSKYLHE